ncbi:hypothetical protein V6N13_037653 [Hibiscus sabdariffa]
MSIAISDPKLVSLFSFLPFLGDHKVPKGVGDPTLSNIGGCSICGIMSGGRPLELPCKNRSEDVWEALLGSIRVYKYELTAVATIDPSNVTPYMIASLAPPTSN